MPGDPGWRLCLFALLLSVGQALSGDLDEGKADSRSGGLLSSFNFEDEEEGAETLDEDNAEHTLPISEDRLPDVLLDLINQKDESPGSVPQDLLKHYHDVVQDDILLPEELNNGEGNSINEYPLKELEIQKSESDQHGLSSRLIPDHEYIMLPNIPGSHKMTCTREGEFHHVWSPGHLDKCMVCACVNYYGTTRLICAKCSICSLEPPAPYTSPKPGPKPDEAISCKPLPVDIPFQSPMDPCKICICTESTDVWGEKDVQIKCFHNPQCVVQPTSHTPYPTPIPSRLVCDKFPQGVPFPHPQDPCQTCMCTTTLSPFEQHISCEIIPECRPDTESPGPGPTTISPLEPEICYRQPLGIYFPHPFDHCQMCKCINDNIINNNGIRKICFVVPGCLPPTTFKPEPSPIIPISSTTQPENAKCEPLPVDEPFQNPMNPCQICICTEQADVFGEITVKIECKENKECVSPPDVTTLPPHPSSPVPWSICGKFPENVYFPHPEDACELCKCTVNLDSTGLPVPHISCIAKPECVPTVTPHHISPTPEPSTTPRPLPPQPENARCAPLPVGIPFQNPINPCQICICTEQIDVFGQVDVQIECQDNQQCVLPPEIITLPPIVTPVPLPACGKFPENVFFPHPADVCQMCKCSLVTNENGVPVPYIDCYTKPECTTSQRPSSTTELPYTTPVLEPITIPPPPTAICERYPVDVYFQHPNDRCQFCKCIANPNSYYIEKIVICQVVPDCRILSTPAPQPSTTTLSTLPPQPDNAKCAPLPVNVPFQNPINPCQICVCSEQVDVFGRIDVQIECEDNLQCVLPPDSTSLPPVVTPIPLPACEQFPENVYFPHPRDVCQVCKCSVAISEYGVPESYINCFTKPECSATTPVPIYTTPETPIITPGPEPTTLPSPPEEICEGHPAGVLFVHPKDRCQICKCIVNPNIFIYKMMIICHVIPDCLLPSTPIPPPSTTPSSLPPQPENAKCAPLPVDESFQNPMNPCQICICTERADVFGKINVQIECKENPLCVVPPDSITLPPIVTPVPLPACGQFPENVFFPHPADNCQVCKCSDVTNTNGVTEPYIDCITKPECLPQPTTPDTIAATCAPLPSGKPFPNPLNPCQVCVCKERVDFFGRHDITIECEETFDCIIPPDVPTLPPIIIKPIPFPMCIAFPVDVPFPHPKDSCQSCQCSQDISPAGYSQPVIYCTVIFECQPTSQPITEPTSQPTPETTSLSPEPPQPLLKDICIHYPRNIPFPHPSDSCQMCICYGGVPSSVPGQLVTFDSPEFMYKCFLKANCYPPTAAPITQKPPSPVPLPNKAYCNPLPKNTPFQNPVDPCQTCVCTETTDLLGRPDIIIKCMDNSLCVFPTTTQPITITPFPAPPEPSICEGYPPDVFFPAPEDPCRLCRCTRTSNIFGEAKMEIDCIVNPSCSITSTPAPTTISPWPPVPPGPLPGPFPHESCKPHVPNKPFQHPWDDCQVCLCREHVSMERITIEVNCYTKPSCCIEPPLDVSGGINSARPIVNGLEIEGKNTAYGTTGIPLANGGNLYVPSDGNIISPIEGNLIQPSDAYLIKPADDNAVKGLDDYMIRPSSQNVYNYPSNVHVDGSIIEHTIRPYSWKADEVSADKINVRLSDDVIDSSSEHLLESSSTKLNDPKHKSKGQTRLNKWHPKGLHLIDVDEYQNIQPIAKPWGAIATGHNIIGNNGIRWIFPNGEFIKPQIRPPGEKFVEPDGIKWNQLPNRLLVNPATETIDTGVKNKNFYIHNIPLNRNPITHPIVNDQWSVPNNVKYEHLYHPHGQINMYPSHIHRDQVYGHIYPETEYREGESAVYSHGDVLAPVKQGEIAAYRPNTKPLVVYHSKPSKMRTKSGRPTDYDSIEYK